MYCKTLLSFVITFISVRVDNLWIQVLATNSPEPVAVIPFKNLKPGVQYQFRVIAINGKGISYPSAESVFIKTPGIVTFLW